MTALTYFLGFSYYYIALSQRMHIPYKEYVDLAVIFIQSMIWFRLFNHRSLCSPYHLFFSGVLAFAFSMDTLNAPSSDFIDFLDTGFLYGNFLSPQVFETKLSSIYNLLIDLNGFRYYLVAGICLFLSYIFVTDMSRFTNQMEPTKAGTLVIVSPFTIYLIWHTQEPMVLLLPFLSIFFATNNPLWKSLWVGVLAILHPIGIAFALLNIWKKDLQTAALALAISLLLPAIFFVLLKDQFSPLFLFKTKMIYLAAVVTLVLGFILPLEMCIKNNRLTPSLVSIFAIGLLALYPTGPDIRLYTIILLFIFSALSFQVHTWVFLSLLVSIYIQLSRIYFEIPTSVYSTIFGFLLCLVLFSYFREKGTEKSYRPRPNL